MRRYRRRANTGMRCQKWQRIPGPGGLLRCKQFVQLPRRRGDRPGHNLGKRCVRFKRVFGPWYDKRVWRCAKYGTGMAAQRPRRVRVQPRPKYRAIPLPERRGVMLRPEGPPGRVPLSLPSMERAVAGRTPTRKSGSGFF